MKSLSKLVSALFGAARSANRINVWASADPGKIVSHYKNVFVYKNMKKSGITKNPFK